jgi:hypothetical protein
LTLPTVARVCGPGGGGVSIADVVDWPAKVGAAAAAGADAAFGCAVAGIAAASIRADVTRPAVADSFIAILLYFSDAP